MEFKLTITDNETKQQQTQTVTGTDKQNLIRQYESMNYTINSIEEMAERQTPDDRVVDPFNVQIPNMAQHNGALPPVNTPAVHTPVTPQWKEFEAAGLKFRIDTTTQELEEFTWQDSEDDSILDDIGISLAGGDKLTFREILELAKSKDALGLHDVLGFINKTWQKKEGES
tara:strand:+ start:5605 stop:6117 length:513 start_codon:yes stop_codon:yes gene_type:complete